MKFILRSIILLTAAPSIILAADSDPSYLWSKAVEAVNWVGHAKFDYVCHQSSVRIRDSRKTESSSEANGTIWQLTPRMRVDASSHAKGDTLPPAISTKILTPKERFIWFKDDSIEINRASRIFHEEAGSHYALFIFTWPLDGVAILDSKTQVLDLKTVGQRGKLTRLADETISGFLCNVVRAEGDGWTCTIWVSPERDYNLARYHLQVMENPAIAGRGGSVSLVNCDYEKLPDGRWYVCSGHLYEYSISKTNKATRLWVDAELKRSNVRFLTEQDAEKEKLFTPPAIPDGTKVFITDETTDGKPIPSPMPHVWKSGGPVPAYDPATVERLRERVNQARNGS